MKMTYFTKEILSKVLDNFCPDDADDHQGEISEKVSKEVRENDNGANKDQRSIIAEFIGYLNEIIIKSMDEIL
jgi:hypothetical protein